MSPYQHLFSTNAVLNVWRNLRSNSSGGGTRGDASDLLLTFQYHPDDVHVRRNAGRFPGDVSGKSGAVVEASNEDAQGRLRSEGVVAGAEVGSRSIGFVVPWRSMQAQKRELREKEKELAEALVVLAGEVAFTDLSESLQTSLSTNPLIQIRHLCAGLSRQLSKIELQMADNAPYCRGKNLYTGGEIARKFLPPIQLLFNQRPVPQRMIFELLMEVKDSVYAGMADCAPEVLEWELNNFTTFEELDELIVRALLPPPPSQRKQRRDVSPSPSTLLEDSHPDKETKHQGDEEDITPNTSRPRRRLLLTPLTPTFTPTPPTSWLLSDPDEALYALESLEATSAAMLALPVPTSDFLAKSILTLRRLLPRRTLADAAARRKKRKGRCGEYARCMKWAGAQWRAEGGCGRGCRDEDEVGEEGLPSWHRGSRHFEKVGEFVLTGG